MKRSAILTLLAAAAISCSDGGKPQVSNTPSTPERAERLQETTVHTTEKPSAPTPAAGSSPTKWSQSGNPIDTSEFDAKVESTAKALKANSSDAAKKAAAEALFERGFALTEARQYAAALGDYRKALKLDPQHEESQKWIKQIIGIYEMMKMDYPPEGHEPPALPFKKEAK